MIVIYDKDLKEMVSVSKNDLISGVIRSEVNTYSSIELSVNYTALKGLDLDKIFYIMLQSDEENVVTEDGVSYVKVRYKKDLNYTGVKTFTVLTKDVEDNQVNFTGYDITKDVFKYGVSSADFLTEYGTRNTYKEIVEEINKLLPYREENGVKKPIINTVNVLKTSSEYVLDYGGGRVSEIIESRPVKRFLTKQDFKVDDILNKLIEDNKNIIWYVEQGDIYSNHEYVSNMTLCLSSPRLTDEPQRVLMSDKHFNDMVVTSEIEVKANNIYPRGKEIDIEEGGIIKVIQWDKIVRSRKATKFDIDENEPDNLPHVNIRTKHFSVSQGDPFNSVLHDVTLQVPQLDKLYKGVIDRTEIVDFPNITDPVKLAYAGYEYALSKLVPRKSYSLKVASEDISIDLGRVITLVRESDNTFVNSIITGVEFDILNPNNTEIILGATYSKNELDKLSEIDKKIKVLRKAVKKGMFNEYSGYLDISSNGIIDTESDMYYGSDESGESAGWTTYNDKLENNPTKAMSYNKNGFRISNSTGANGRRVWTTAIDFDGINASAVKSGLLKSQYVEIGQKTTFKSGYNPMTKLPIEDFNVWKSSISSDYTELKGSLSTCTSSITKIGLIADNNKVEIGALKGDVESLKDDVVVLKGMIENIDVTGGGTETSVANVVSKGNYLLRENFKDGSYAPGTTKVGTSGRDKITVVKDETYDKVLNIYKESYYGDDVGLILKAREDFVLKNGETVYLSLLVNSTVDNNNVWIALRSSVDLSVRYIGSEETLKKGWVKKKFSYTNNTGKDITGLLVNFFFCSNFRNYTEGTSVQLAKIVLSKESTVDVDTVKGDTVNDGSGINTAEFESLKNAFNYYKVLSNNEIDKIKLNLTNLNSSTSSLNNFKEATENKLSSMTSKINKQDDDIGNLNINISSINTRADEVEFDVSKLKNEFSVLSEGIKPLTDKVLGFEGVLSGMESKLTTTTDDLSALDIKYNKVIGTVDSVRGELELEKELNSKQTLDIDLVKEEIESIRESVESGSSDTNLEEEITYIKTLAENIKGDILQIRDDITNLQLNGGDGDTTIDSEVIQTLRSDIDSLISTDQYIDGLLDSMRIENVNISEEISALKEVIAGIKNTGVGIDLSPINLKLEELTKQLNSLVIPKEVDLSPINLKLEELTKQINSLEIPKEVNLTPLNNSIKTLEDRLKLLEGVDEVDLKPINLKLDKLTEQLNSLEIPKEVDLSSINNSIKSLGDEISTLKGNNELLQKGVNKSELKIKDLEDISNNQGVDILTLQENKLLIENELNEVKTDITILKGGSGVDLSPLKDDVQNLKEMDSVLSTRISELERTSEAIDLEPLKNRLSEVEFTNSTQSDSLSVLKTDVDNLKVYNAVMKSMYFSDKELELLNRVDEGNLLLAEGQNTAGIRLNSLSKLKTNLSSLKAIKDKEFHEVARINIVRDEPLKMPNISYVLKTKKFTLLKGESLYFSMYIRSMFKPSEIRITVMGKDVETGAYQSVSGMFLTKVGSDLELVKHTFVNNWDREFDNVIISIKIMDTDVIGDGINDTTKHDLDVVRTYLSKTNNKDVSYIENYMTNNSFNKLDNKRLREELKALGIGLK